MSANFPHIELEPNNDDVGSKLTVIDTEGKSYLKVYDCDEVVKLGFKHNIEGIKKLERIRVVLDSLEKSIQISMGV